MSRAAYLLMTKNGANERDQNKLILMHMLRLTEIANIKDSQSIAPRTFGLSHWIQCCHVSRAKSESQLT